MHSKRLGVGVAVVNRLLYAIGGFDGNERLASIECYHPENNAWTVLPPMKIGRSGAGVAAYVFNIIFKVQSCSQHNDFFFNFHRLNQYIYVVGGFDGSRQLASVERYDTENEVWHSLNPIKISRSALSLTVLDGKLYAMGGFDGQSFLSLVEVYDPVQDKWEEGTALTSGRSGHASAVIYQPSCASLYMDCMEEQISKDKKSQNPSDEDDKGGTSSNKNPQPSTSNQLQAFSGKCCQCDETTDNPTEHENHMNTAHKPKNLNSCDDGKHSEYEQECRNAIYSLLRMECEEERQFKNECKMETMIIDESANDVPGNNCNIDNDSMRKYRRNVSFQSEDSIFSENSNSMDSCSSINIIPDLRNRLKSRQSENSHQCSLSKLKNKVQKNITDFVAWSSASVAQVPKSIAKDLNNNKTSITSRKLIKKDERKCDLPNRFYKTKLNS